MEYLVVILYTWNNCQFGHTKGKVGHIAKKSVLFLLVKTESMDVRAEGLSVTSQFK